MGNKGKLGNGPVDAGPGSAIDLCKDAECTDYEGTLHRHYSALISLITGESLHMDIHRMQNQHNDNKHEDRKSVV